MLYTLPPTYGLYAYANGFKSSILNIHYIISLLFWDSFITSLLQSALYMMSVTVVHYCCNMFLSKQP